MPSQFECGSGVFVSARPAGPAEMIEEDLLRTIFTVTSISSTTPGPAHTDTSFHQALPRVVRKLIGPVAGKPGCQISDTTIWEVHLSLTRALAKKRTKGARHAVPRIAECIVCILHQGEATECAILTGRLLDAARLEAPVLPPITAPKLTFELVAHNIDGPSVTPCLGCPAPVPTLLLDQLSGALGNPDLTQEPVHRLIVVFKPTIMKSTGLSP